MPEALPINRKKSQGFQYQLLLKLILLVSILIIGGVAILDFFFIDQLSKYKLTQIYEAGETTAIITSDLALSALYSRKPQYVNKPLTELFERSSNQNKFLFQISVILSNGIYYASTNKDLKNKNIHSKLLEKIKQHKGYSTQIEKIYYKTGNKTIIALQFLRNIVVRNGKEDIHVATTQVLYNYSSILDKTRQSLFIIGSLIFFLTMLVIVLIYFPITRDLQKLIEAIKQVKKKNFEYRLQVNRKDELGKLFAEYNSMAEIVRQMMSKRPNGKLNVGDMHDSAIPSDLPDLTLRKTEVTCLCAKIPKIQKQIEDDESGLIANFISEIITPLDKSAQSSGGQIVKIIGDKVFVLFEGINSIDNAVRAALKVNQTWKTINHERKVLGKDLLDHGIGLHSATGLVGSLATSLENFTVIGEAASIAEFLCTCSKREEVLISASMMEKTNGSYQHQGIENLNSTPLSDEEVFSLIGSGVSTSSVADSQISSLTGNNHVDNAPVRSYDSSIPDILEETLSTTPLDLVNIEEKETDIKLSQNITENSFKDEDTVEFNDIPIEEEFNQNNGTESLWNKISSEVKTEED